MKSNRAKYQCIASREVKYCSVILLFVMHVSYIFVTFCHVCQHVRAGLRQKVFLTEGHRQKSLKKCANVTEHLY